MSPTRLLGLALVVAAIALGIVVAGEVHGMVGA